MAALTLATTRTSMDARSMCYAFAEQWLARAQDELEKPQGGSK
jgi:hypothetical protein